MANPARTTSPPSQRSRGSRRLGSAAAGAAGADCGGGVAGAAAGVGADMGALGSKSCNLVWSSGWACLAACGLALALSQPQAASAVHASPASPCSSPHGVGPSSTPRQLDDFFAELVGPHHVVVS